MPFVTQSRWNARRWGTQTIDAIDGAPQAILDAWGVPIRKRWLGDFTGDVVPLANGKRFRVGPNELLRWEHASQENLAADFPGLAEAGGFKETIQLDAPPPVARWRSQLEAPPGVRFEYQPPLTQAEVDEGASRPEWAVGSWAVFDATGCKIGHIPRPVAVTADGARHWFDLAVNPQPPWGAILTLTGNLAWLETLPASAWPVLVDPTFGYTTLGASTSTSANAVCLVGGVHTAAAGDAITGFHLACDSYPDIVAYVLPSGVGTVPGARLGTPVTLDTTDGHWRYVTGLSVAMTAGVVYAPAFQQGTSLHFDTGTGNWRAYRTGGTLPDPWDNQQNISGTHYSIYATYTAAPVGPTAAQLAAALQTAYQLPRRPPPVAVPY